MQQMQAARREGFDVPRTLVTNSAEEAASFCKEVGYICTKSLKNPYIISEGRMHPWFTRMVSLDELESNAASIARCPILLQEYVDKVFDLRIIVMGDEVIPFRIDSQENTLSQTDVRGASPHLIRHGPYQLPASVDRAVRSFVRRQGLAFSAIDVAVGRDGRYYFLENNPNGQWLWLELLTGARLSDALIRLLFAD
jgi:glutathione synthase/RimK-type ligase-like ATP-grasp enzyme